MKLRSISGSCSCAVLRGTAAGAAGRTGRPPGRSSRPSSARCRRWRCRRVAAGPAKARRRPPAPGRRRGCGWCRHRPRAQHRRALEQPLARRAARGPARRCPGCAGCWPHAAAAAEGSAPARSASTRRCARGVCGAPSVSRRRARRRSRRRRRWWRRRPAPGRVRRRKARSSACVRDPATSGPGSPGGGARCTTRVARPARRAATRAGRGRPQRHDAAGAQLGHARGVDVSASSAPGPQHAPRAGRRRRNRRQHARAAETAGQAPRGFWLRAKSDVAAFSTRARGYPTA
jgi:hypothetical protein